MSKIINPRMAVRIFGVEDLVISKATPSTDDYLYMDFNIQKDFDEEPNEADLTIYNLSETTRKKISDFANQAAPVEIYLTPSGVDELVRAYRGEIDWAGHRSNRPGYETEIHCTSQKEQHRSLFINQKTFPKGTPVAVIVMFLVNEIGMPSELIQFPNVPILKAESFTGPAFPLLRRYVQYLGMHCFITDGVLRLASVNAPQNPMVYPLEKRLMLEDPEETTRIDLENVELKMMADLSGKDPLAPKRRKRKKKRSKIIGKSDYISYEAVDKTIHGVNLEMLCQPDRKPDDVVMLPKYPALAGRFFRVREVHHHGNNYGGDWTTRMDCDEYEGSAADLAMGL